MIYLPSDHKTFCAQRYLQRQAACVCTLVVSSGKRMRGQIPQHIQQSLALSFRQPVEQLAASFVHRVTVAEAHRPLRQSSSCIRSTSSCGTPPPFSIACKRRVISALCAGSSTRERCSRKAFTRFRSSGVIPLIASWTSCTVLMAQTLPSPTLAGNRDLPERRVGVRRAISTAAQPDHLI